MRDAVHLDYDAVWSCGLLPLFQRKTTSIFKIEVGGGKFLHSIIIQKIANQIFTTWKPQILQ